LKVSFGVRAERHDPIIALRKSQLLTIELLYTIINTGHGIVTITYLRRKKARRRRSFLRRLRIKCDNVITKASTT
jgi:hypothetical protein